MRNVSTRQTPVGKSGAMRWGMAAVVLAIGLAFHLPGAARAQSVSESDAPQLSVRKFGIRYLSPHDNLPTLDDLYNVTTRFHRVAGGFTAAPADGPGFPYTVDDEDLRSKKFSRAAIKAIETSLRQYLNSRGLIAVLVYAADPRSTNQDNPDPLDYAAVANNQRSLDLTFVVVVGTVKDVVAKTSGSHSGIIRIGSSHPVEKRILANSPIKAGGTLDRVALKDYLLELNRQPLRHVESAITSAQSPLGDEVELNYLITQAKPWTVYLQASNTGTRDTSSWHERFGFTDTQLTNNDDILSLDYDTASFRNTDEFETSYDFPVLNFESLRGRVYGSLGRFTASDVGLSLQDINGHSQELGGEVSATVFQYHELFLDMLGGLKVDNFTAKNKQPGLPTTFGDGSFLLPYVGLRLTRDTPLASSSAGLTFLLDPTFPDSPSNANLQQLGRLDAQRNYAILQAYASQSFYIEPFFSGWQDRDLKARPTAANEMLFSAHGQLSMDDKSLIPELQEDAGGLYSVRGYAQSVAAGDSVIIGSAEYRLHLPRLMGIAAANEFAGHRIPAPPLMGDTFHYQPSAADTPGDWDLILKAFIDGAYTHSNHALIDNSVDNGLVGVGPGIELQIRDNVDIQVDYGVALTPSSGVVNNTARTQITSPGSGQFNFLFTFLY